MSLLKVTQLTHSFLSSGGPGMNPWADRGLQPLNSQHPHFPRIPGSVDSCTRRRSQVGAQTAHSREDSIASLRLCCFSFFPWKTRLFLCHRDVLPPPCQMTPNCTQSSISKSHLASSVFSLSQPLNSTCLPCPASSETPFPLI